MFSLCSISFGILKFPLNFSKLKCYPDQVAMTINHYHVDFVLSQSLMTLEDSHSRMAVCEHV